MCVCECVGLLLHTSRHEAATMPVAVWGGEFRFLLASVGTRERERGREREESQGTLSVYSVYVIYTYFYACKHSTRLATREAILHPRPSVIRKKKYFLWFSLHGT